MAITSRVPVPRDWDRIPAGTLVQATCGGEPVLGVRATGDGDGVLVLRGSPWDTLPAWAPVDAFDGPPLVLPGEYLVEATPSRSGDYEATRKDNHGHLRVADDGLAGVVVTRQHFSKVYDLASGGVNVGNGQFAAFFPAWRIVQLSDTSGEPRTIFERGAEPRA